MLLEQDLTWELAYITVPRERNTLSGSVPRIGEIYEGSESTSEPECKDRI